MDCNSWFWTIAFLGRCLHSADLTSSSATASLGKGIGLSIRDVEPPEGEPTFVFTDIEASSALWEAVPDAMRRALRIHDALMHAACSAHHGYAVKSEGDAFMIAFAEPRQAMGFAHLVQQTLAKMTWPKELEDLNHEPNHQYEQKRHIGALLVLC